MKKKKHILLKIFGGIIFTLSAIYAVNRIIFYISTKKEQLYTKNGHFYKHRHGKIFYTKSGSGSPLLLIHDLHCCSSEYEWHEVVKKFSDHHTVYTIDLLGCGRSDKPRITYTSYLYVQLLHDFITDIIGESTEAIITGRMVPISIMLEKFYPNTFSRGIYVNPVDFEDVNTLPSRKDERRKDLMNTPVLGTLLYLLCTSRSALLKKFRTEYFNDSSTRIFSYMSKYHEAAHKGGSASKFLYSSLQNKFLNCNIIDQYSSISVPTCVILGENMEFSKDITEWSVFLNPDTEVAILPNSKYLPQIESSDEFYGVCETYLLNGTIED